MPSPSPSIVFLITGASRGFGRSLAQLAIECFKENVVRLVLVARLQEGLDETARLLSDGRSASNNCSCHAMDLGDLQSLDQNLDVLLEDLQVESHDRVVLIQNAGTIGHLGPCMDSPSLQDMQDNVDLNITSSLWMAARFSKHTRDAKSCRATIVNISSLAAIADFPTFGIYSAGKAAREKYHALIPKETPEMQTLNYAPGPLETDMVTEIRKAEQLDAGLKPNFEKQLLDPLDSARKLMRLLQRNDFESGTHIDYYDLPDEK